QGIQVRGIVRQPQFDLGRRQLVDEDSGLFDERDEVLDEVLYRAGVHVACLPRAPLGLYMLRTIPSRTRLLKMPRRMPSASTKRSCPSMPRRSAVWMSMLSASASRRWFQIACETQNVQ